MSLPLKGPPAVWAAFVTQARWKNWVLLGQLLIIAFLVAVCLELATRPPDVVVVSETGDSTYLPANATNRALLDFVRNQRQVATATTIVAFTRRFVTATAAVNSSTIDEAWSEALQMMAAPLAEKVDQDAKAAKLLETYRLAQVRTTLAFKGIELVERRGEKALVRATVLRHRERLIGGRDGSDDGLVVQLVLVDVPRSSRHPDGLEVFDWRTSPYVESVVDAGVEPIPTR